MKKTVFVITFILLSTVVLPSRSQEILSPAPVPSVNVEENKAPNSDQLNNPALTKIIPGSKLFIPADDFGLTMTAAIKKKNVPLTIVTVKSRADFFLQTSTEAKKEGTGERITKLLLFGGFAGSGKSFDARVNITNRDGDVIFAHNSEKGNQKKAASRIASKLKKHIEENL